MQNEEAKKRWGKWFYFPNEPERSHEDYLKFLNQELNKWAEQENARIVDSLVVQVPDKGRLAGVKIKVEFYYLDDREPGVGEQQEK